MFRRILRRMVQNGSRQKADLGLRDAIEAEDALEATCQELECSQEAFDTRVNNLNAKIRRKTDQTRKTDILPR